MFWSVVPFEADYEYERHFAHAKTIILVQDNLSIHSKASLYEAFPAVEARRLVELAPPISS